ncbi:unnamed protein product [Absidia cylindrospora]
MSSDTKLILSWIKKITAKLPYHSGQSFGTLEHDPVLCLSDIVDSNYPSSVFLLSLALSSKVLKVYLYHHLLEPQVIESSP